MELRTCKYSIRADEAADNHMQVIRGYALRWNDTTDLSYEGDGSLLETFSRGAFTDTLKNDDIAMKIEHGGPAIASTQNNTLNLNEDDDGLAFSATLDTRDTDANNAWIRTDNGTSQGVSVGFQLRGEGGNYEVDDDGGITTLTIKSVARLFEISLVHFPAYTSSEVSARNFENSRQLIKNTLQLRKQTIRTSLLKAKVLETEINL